MPARAAWAARALLRLCVICVFLRALLAARVRCWRVVFVFLARVVGGRCVGAGAALRFVSGARCARAVFVFVARVAGGRCVGAGVAVRFVFLARVAGGRCVCASGALRFFFAARRGRVARVCCWCAAFFSLRRVAGGRCLGVRFYSSGARRWRFGPLFRGLLWRGWVRLVRLSGFLAFCAVVVVGARLLRGFAYACTRRRAALP